MHTSLDLPMAPPFAFGWVCPELGGIARYLIPERQKAIVYSYTYISTLFLHSMDMAKS